MTTAIREATAAELAEHGYAGVTFEGVARRAQTSKPVLYRRYASRAHLVIDSWSALAPLAFPESSTGSLRDDLVAVLETIHHRFERVGVDAFRRVIAEADDALLEAVTAFTWEAAKTALSSILAAARDRGELGGAAVPERVLLQPLVLLRHELFFLRGPLAADATAQMVDQVCVPLLRTASGQEGPV